MTPTLHPIAFALCLLAAPGAAQDPAAASTARLSEWPALKATDADRARASIGQFRKADPALHAAAQKELLALGAGAAPILFAQVSDAPQNLNDALFAVLDALLRPEHADLMVRECGKKKVALRRYLMLRLCRFVDPKALPALQAALQDKDEATAFYAALGALALKQRDGLAGTLAYSKLRWLEVAPLAAEVLPHARSQEAGAWVFEAIVDAPVPEQMAGLRLARYLAVKDHAVILHTYLRAADHGVKKEAVNTMRVLHGEQPIENLTVFKAIEMAKEWLAKG